MFGFKKALPIVAAVIACFCVTSSVCAVGTDELEITANASGSYDLQIDLKNISDYYLANVDIKVDGAGGTTVNSYGFFGSDGVRQIALGESVSAYASIDPSSMAQATAAKPNTPQQTPSQSTTAKQHTPSGGNSIQNNTQGNNSGQNAGQGSPSYVDPTVNDGYGYGYDESPVFNGNGNGDSYADNDYDYNELTDDTASDDNAFTSEDGSDVTDTGTGAESTDEVPEGVSSTVHTVHSMAPGESVTIQTTLSDGTESEIVGTKPSGVIPPYVFCIAGGVVVVLGVAAFIVIKKKKKDAAKDVALVIVIALLLTGIASADTGMIYADPVSTASSSSAVKDPVAGSVSATVQFPGAKGDITITATYTVVPAAVVEPLKSSRRPQANSDCDIPKVDERRIKEGAGPLTDFGIYIGKNDFMFYGDAIKDYKGETVMNASRLNKLSQMMNERDSWANSNGIKLYLVIAPNKTSVYPEYVPSKVTAAQKTNADAVVEYLAQNSSVEVIDLRQALINAKGEYGDSMFYKYDTHWNNNGGFVGYTEVMRRINEDVTGAYTLKKSDFTIADYETYMKDMAYYLGYYSAYTDYGPVYTLKSGMTADLITKGSYDWHGQFYFCSRWKDGYADSLKYVTYENIYNAGAPSVYMYRDSFSVSMIHFFKDSFHKSVFDWSYDFNKDEVIASGADVVIMEVVEKQLYEFTNSRTFS